MTPRSLLLVAGLLPAVWSCDAAPTQDAQGSRSRKARKALKTRRSRPKPSNAKELRGTLALPAGTRLHVEPSASAWGFDLRLGGIGETEPEQSTAYFEVKAERAGWVELATLTTTLNAKGPNACPPSVTGLDRLSLRLYVSKAGLDLSTLDPRPLSERFPCPSDARKEEFIPAGDPPLPELQAGSRYVTEHSVEHELAAGSTLYWPDGALAGRSTAAIRFVDAPQTRGKRSCVAAIAGDTEMTFEGPRPPAQLSLCAPASAFTEIPYEDPRERERERAAQVAMLGVLGMEGGGDLLDDGNLDLAQLLAEAQLSQADSVVGSVSDIDSIGSLDDPNEVPGLSGSIAPSGGVINVATLDGPVPSPDRARWSGVRVSGELSQAQASLMLRRMSARFRVCYERALMTSSMIPPTAMQFTMHFGPAGEFVSSDNEPKFAPTAQACVDAATSRLRSPAAGKVEAKIDFGGGPLGELPFD